jgi:dehydrogenase/reductase SDR family member 7B
MYFKDKTIWITGASSGIGAELASQFAKHGANLILTSRKTDKLEKLASDIRIKYQVTVHVVPLDLTRTESIHEAYTTIHNKNIFIDILINNGGISQRSGVLETPIDIDRKIFETNFFGAITLTKFLLPGMVSKGGGHIVVISSVVGKFGFPLRTSYSASKHALHGFFESLRAELSDSGIDVTIICPGRIKTSISLNAITKDGSPHGQMDEGQAKGMKVETCVKKIIHAVRKKKKISYIGRKEVLMVFIRLFLPVLYYKIVNKVKAK